MSQKQQIQKEVGQQADGLSKVPQSGPWSCGGLPMDEAVKAVLILRHCDAIKFTDWLAITVVLVLLAFRLACWGLALALVFGWVGQFDTWWEPWLWALGAWMVFKPVRMVIGWSVGCIKDQVVHHVAYHLYPIAKQMQEHLSPNELSVLDKTMNQCIVELGGSISAQSQTVARLLGQGIEQSARLGRGKKGTMALMRLLVRLSGQKDVLSPQEIQKVVQEVQKVLECLDQKLVSVQKIKVQYEVQQLEGATQEGMEQDGGQVKNQGSVKSKTLRL